MRGRGYDELRAWGLGKLKETMLRISVLGMTLDLLIAASTLLPGAPVVPQWPQFVLFPFIFVVHFSSVLRLTPKRGRLRWRDLVAGVPPAIGVGLGVLFVGAWLGAMASITGIGGQPTISGGHYYLNNHGSFIAVTRAGYDHALVLQQRIFTLIPAMFFGVGVLVHYPRQNGQAASPGIQPWRTWGRDSARSQPTTADSPEQARELDLQFRAERLRFIVQSLVGLLLMAAFVVVEHFPVALAAFPPRVRHAGSGMGDGRLTRASRAALEPFRNPTTGELNIPGGRAALTLRALRGR